jgi:hypothetical protein
MVPLYAVNYEKDDQPLERVWFSDGGITSNFPVHRYDSMFPRWPTLAINLQDTDAEGKPSRKNVLDGVFLPEGPGDAQRDLWTPFAGGSSAMGNLLGFGGAVFRSAQVWHDNSFLRLPGYRDRVAEVWLEPHEGGLNLNMEPEVITALAERGERAGTRLRDRFVDSSPEQVMSWDSHRWVRYRSGMAALTRMLNQFEHNAANPLPDDLDLDSLVGPDWVPPQYKFQSEHQRSECAWATGLIRDMIRQIQRAESCTEGKEVRERPFCKGPNPPISFGSRASM